MQYGDGPLYKSEYLPQCVNIVDGKVVILKKMLSKEIEFLIIGPMKNTVSDIKIL